MPAHVRDIRGTTRPKKRTRWSGEAAGWRNYPNQNTVHPPEPRPEAPAVSWWADARLTRAQWMARASARHFLPEKRPIVFRDRGVLSQDC